MPVDGCIVHSLPRIENINPAASLIVGCGGCFFVAFPGVLGGCARQGGAAVSLPAVRVTL